MNYAVRGIETACIHESFASLLGSSELKAVLSMANRVLQGAYAQPNMPVWLASKDGENRE
jgi:hypothetical protein